MQEEYIRTNRLILRKVDPHRLDVLFSKNDTEGVMRFFGSASMDEAKKEKERHEKGLTTFNRSFLYFHLLDKSTEQVIGWCGYHTWYTEHDRAEMGYGLFGEELKGKGLMSEAMITILDYGFQKMNLHRIEAMVGRENHPSIRLLEKFGFSEEGILREHYKVNEVHEDSLVYGLLRTESQTENE